ncbi:MAG: hypothetical protein Q8L81_09395 [Bacteroidota bacterium]|nr:hypothetical protein [Bacteroidota bacterium]
MNKISFLFTGIFIIALLVSCENKIGKLEPKTPPVPPSACDSVKFAAYIHPVIIANCTSSGCHNAGSTNGDYTTYAGVLAKVNANGAFKSRVISGGTPMPPSGRLAQAKLDSIQCWLDKGAPNN